MIFCQYFADPYRFISISIYIWSQNQQNCIYSTSGFIWFLRTTIIRNVNTIEWQLVRMTKAQIHSTGPNFQFLDFWEQRHGNVKTMVSNFLTRLQGCKLWPRYQYQYQYQYQYIYMSHLNLSQLDWCSISVAEKYPKYRLYLPVPYRCGLVDESVLHLYYSMNFFDIILEESWLSACHTRCQLQGSIASCMTGLR